MVGKLKAVKLATLKPGLHSDGGGLYLNVEPSGSRSWILRCTIKGKRSWLGLGSVTAVLLGKARNETNNLRLRARERPENLQESRKEKEAKRGETQKAN